MNIFVEILTVAELKDKGKLFSRAILDKSSSTEFYTHINDFNEAYKVGERDVILHLMKKSTLLLMLEKAD